MAGGPPTVPVKSSSGEMEITPKHQPVSLVLFDGFDRKKRIDRPRWSRYISTVECKCLPMEEVLR